MNQELTLQPVVQAVVALAVAVLTVCTPIVVKAGAAWLELVKVKLETQILTIEDERVRKAVDAAVAWAVKSAEQEIKTNGEAKKKRAIELAENWLASRGIDVDLDLLAARIEAAVYDEFNGPFVSRLEEMEGATSGAAG